LGLRWSFMGPFETIDLNAPDGLADYAHRFGGMYQSIAKEQTSTEPWSEALIAKLEGERRKVLPKDQLLARRLWRDRRLMALAAHKKTVE
jgi:L-gulonate 3-dehydrogenase